MQLGTGTTAHSSMVVLTRAVLTVAYLLWEISKRALQLWQWSLDVACMTGSDSRSASVCVQ